MMKMILKLILLSSLFLGCQQKEITDFGEIMKDSPSIDGKSEYLNSPYVTPGNRVYSVGHQNGAFPELGWHIENEMGGIWNHPIKLMDGFQINLVWDDSVHSLDNAQTFTNYPFANKHAFSISNKNLQVERWQFVPDDKEGMVVQLVIKNKSKSNQEFKLQFVGSSELRPTWLGERTNMKDSPDEGVFDEENDAWLVKDSLNPWFLLFGADEKSINHNAVESNYSGNGISRSMEYDVSVPGNETKIVNFVIAGSYLSKEAAEDTYRDIKNHFITYFQEKKHRYGQLETKSKLTIPDKKLQETFEWLKYNSDWMIQTVPEIGTGITAGIPDYPWWFGCDSEYALKGYLAIGQYEVVLQTIELLDSISNAVNGNGRILHEVSTNGAVFNPGNINETPQFASLIWETYKWNGDKDFLKKYFPTVKTGLEWLMTENDENKNLFPEGSGMMEIHGLDSEMIDVAAYTQRAFVDAALMAQELGELELSTNYEKLAQELKEKINQEFWSEEFSSYADFISTDDKAIELIDDAIERAKGLNKPWAVKELEQTKETILNNPSTEVKPYVLHHNFVVNTPLEMQIADEKKAIRALNTASKYVNPFGVFVTGIDRDELSETEDGSFKGTKSFSYVGAVMTLPTGVQAVAENNYGRVNEGLDYLKRMTRSFSYAHPGSMYEVSPDYGMLVQAWNIYSFAVPIVNQFFGINPLASEKKVVIKPQMPDEWDQASIENVIIADTSVSVFYNNSDGVIELKVVQENPEWNVEIQLPEKQGEMYFQSIESSIKPEKNKEHLIFSSDSQSTEVVLKYTYSN